MIFEVADLAQEVRVQEKLTVPKLTPKLEFIAGIRERGYLSTKYCREAYG